MAQRVAHLYEREDAGAVIRKLDRLVTCGPRDLEIVAAMWPLGYDTVKWAEGQALLAELVASGECGDAVGVAATWYQQAATAARDALVGQPELLAKVGVAGRVFA